MTIKKLDLGGMDLLGADLDKFERLFPDLVTEERDETGRLKKSIDFEKFKARFSADIISEGKERYEFTWPGKRAAMAEANSPINKTLRPVMEESKNWDSTENLYIEGDNLEVLKLLQESYLGKVKMIYIDPPYNTGNDFVYNDDFKENLEEYNEDNADYDEEGGKLIKNTESNGRFHSDWCSMIYPRLKLARNLLTYDGVIFISIDDNEQENLKKICDEVFGENNIINTFIWNCSTAGGIRPKFASKTHEYIFMYAKNKENVSKLYVPLSDKAKSMYTEKDSVGVYRNKDFVFKNKSQNENQKYEIVCPDGEKVVPKDGYIYRFIKSSFEDALGKNMVTFKRTTTGPLLTVEGNQANWNIYIKKYLGDALGAPSTLIPKEMTSFYNSGTQCVQNLFNGRRVFENVKPIETLSYLANMIGDDNALIMDFFSGFRVIIMTQANSQVNTRVLELLPKFKIKKMNRWCAV